MNYKKLEWHYPAKPFHLNQAWGILNPIYKRFGFERHNGIDFALETDAELHYPWSGTGTVVKVGEQSGGGIYVGILSNEKYEFPDKGAYILSDFLHCKEILVKEGDQVRTGDVIAIADNTGFSTGPHTHEQDRRVYKNLNNVDKNDANNSFDPLPYASGVYAEDIGTIREIIAKITKWLNKYIDIKK